MSEEIKPCKCGATIFTDVVFEKRETNGSLEYRLKCNDCGAAGEWGPDKDSAIASWNSIMP